LEKEAIVVRLNFFSPSEVAGTRWRKPRKT